MCMHESHARHTLILFSLIWVVLGEPYAAALKYTWLASWPKPEAMAVITAWMWLLVACCWALTYLIERVMHRHRLH